MAKLTTLTLDHFEHWSRKFHHSKRKISLLIGLSNDENRRLSEKMDYVHPNNPSPLFYVISHELDEANRDKNFYLFFSL